MEVIQNNDPLAADKLYDVQCTTCNALIQFSRSEALSQTENKTATILKIQCPVCSTEVNKTLNKKVQEQVVTVSKYNHIPF